jgi:osmoprotectant transport system permease protein
LALLWLFISPAHGLPSPTYASTHEIKIGSKKFTESVILAEIVAQLAHSAGAQPVHVKELGGTRVLWNSLVKGAIDIYPEYTGTLTQEIFAGQGIDGNQGLRKALATYGIRLTSSLGFNNNYALGMKKEMCKKFGIAKISDLRQYPGLSFGFSNEFMDRKDGWPGLRARYGLPQHNVFGLDHDLALRGLESNSIDATELYTTDPEIDYYGLCALEDDLRYFPEYTAVMVYRADLEKRAPQLVAALARLEGRITSVDMIDMNKLVKMEKMPESQVAANFLTRNLSLQTTLRQETVAARIWQRTKEHLYLVSISLLIAILIGVPLGAIAAKKPVWGRIILSVTGVIQTIPSLALLVFMIPLLGIGGPPVILALFLYSLLPIVRNTHTGLQSIPPEIRDSAEALGLSPWARFRLIELPMASREILAGIKTSAVINVGTATLGALIGAGGYGQPILTGIRLDDLGLILTGAVPAALLALLVQGGFDLAELAVVPKGLRLKPGE